MRLNGGAFNAQVVHGSRRAPVYASAVAAAGFSAEGEGRIEVHGQGVVDVLLRGGLSASALRPATGQAIRVDLQAYGTGARRRVGSGAVSTELDTVADGYRLYRRGFGAATLDLTASGWLRTYRGMDAASLTRLRAEIQLSAQRFAPLRAEVRHQASLAPSVYRIGATRRGFGGLGLLASLYYSRTQYGSGAGVLDLQAMASVGVSFLEGVADMRPMGVALAPNRRRWSPGAASVAVRSDLAPSAVRRLAASPVVDLRFAGALDPAHITVEGVRYLTPDARLRATVGVQDAGLQRRLTSGAFQSAGIQFLAAGLGLRGRTATFTPAPTSLLAHGDFVSARAFPESRAILLATAGGSGEILVQGGGSAVLRLAPTLAGRVERRTTGAAAHHFSAVLGGRRIRRLGGTVVTDFLSAELEASRRRVGRSLMDLALATDLQVARRVFLVATGVLVGVEALGDWIVPARTLLGEAATVFVLRLGQVAWTREHLAELPLALGADGHGRRVVVFDSGAEIQVLGASDAYVNVLSEDADTQTFVRPADLRQFERAADQRLFARTA